MVQKQTEKTKSSPLRNPTTVKLLAKELILASDAYIAKQMDEIEYRELIVYYATYHGKKLFAPNGNLNPTVKDRIGRKRCGLVEVILKGFQITIT
ncbi:uncharacterized protein (TIGR04540 family) [Desulfitispora alkaliphila]|uniref:TIGR04540 family protein n=1 Tax=Desulfitispora alkaliphila TaxID=622674 RepID=UPI003D21325D